MNDLLRDKAPSLRAAAPVVQQGVSESIVELLQEAKSQLQGSSHSGYVTRALERIDAALSLAQAAPAPVRMLTSEELADCCGGCRTNSAIETWMQRAITRFCEVNGLKVGAAPAGVPLSDAPQAQQDDKLLAAARMRTDADYAIEHAEYMAKDAERLIAAVNDLAKAEQEHEEGTANPSDVDAARESVSEAQSSLRSGIYEFRKRRDRALASPAAPAPAGEQK